MLDIPANDKTEAKALKAQKAARPRNGLKRFFRSFSSFVFSSLARRILVLNLVALIVLVSGILYLNQFREGLIDARVESLMTQGEIIAAAIASSASVDTDTLRIDPERLLELQAGEAISPTLDGLENSEFLINPERVAPVLRQLISPTRTRARIYDRDALLLLDSRHLYSGGQILRYQLEPIEGERAHFIRRIWENVMTFFYRRDLPIYREQPGGSGVDYPEVIAALEGRPSTISRMSADNELIVTVAVPVQRFRAVLGVLQLSTQGGDIDKIVLAERLAIVRVFIVAALVTALLSILLASTIATPLKKLSAAAVRVKRGVSSRRAIPDYSWRRDEIGELSVAVGDMTESLHDRIDAIERFAADVAHELKNPLTSLRSAVETLPLVKTDESRARLLAVIEHDVRRLDRLITDISDASRLDAELNRDDMEPVDLAKMVRDCVAAAKQINENTALTFKLDIAKQSHPTGYIARAHDLRIGQVLNNIIDNARSFASPNEGVIGLTMRHDDENIVIFIDDNGPGIRAENIETVFQRFYTDRPGIESFGQNSGLGLSISRQIIEAHSGTLIAENRLGDNDNVLGARFIITLPAFSNKIMGDNKARHA